jgi:hypothetical protein
MNGIAVYSVAANDSHVECVLETAGYLDERVDHSKRDVEAALSRWIADIKPET